MSVCFDGQGATTAIHHTTSCTCMCMLQAASQSQYRRLLARDPILSGATTAALLKHKQLKHVSAPSLEGVQMLNHCDPVTRRLR